MIKVIDRLTQTVRAAAVFNPDVQAAPACTLWPDRDRQWEKALMRLRLFGELLAKNIAARFGVYTKYQSQQNEILKELKYRDILDQKLADTRKMIDQQLRAAGWESDTAEIRYSKGIRPEKGKNKAIAEWPTQRGPADYVLFNGVESA